MDSMVLTSKLQCSVLDTNTIHNNEYYDYNLYIVDSYKNWK